MPDPSPQLDRSSTEAIASNSPAALLSETLMEFAPDAIFVTDIHGILRETNTRACQLLGYSREELLGRAIATFMASDDQARLSADLFRTQNNPHIETWTYVHKDGTPIRVEVSARGVPDGRWVAFVRGLHAIEPPPTSISESALPTPAALREKEQLQELCDSMPQFVWMSNAQGELQYVNRQWVEYSGLTVEQSQNPETIAACYHPDDVQAAFQQWMTALETKQPYEFEGRLRAADGSYRWFLIRILPVFDEQGQVLRWYGTSTDIHDRKIAQLNEQFLTALDSRLRQLAEAEAMAYETVSQVGQYLQADRSMWDRIDPMAEFATIEQDWRRQEEIPSNVGTYRISNYILPDMVEVLHKGQPVVITDVMTHPYTAPFAKNLLQLNMRSYIGVPCIYEGRWVATLNVTSQMVRVWRSDEVALLHEVVARLWALIEQRRAIAALSEREEHIRLATEAADLGMWFWNIPQDELIWTDRCKALFGIALDVQMSYNLFLQALHPDDRDRTHAAVTRTLTERVEYDIEYRTVWPDGSTHWIAAKGRAFYDANGHPQRLMGTAQDITDRKQAELEREQLLAREQAARQEAERANRLKDEFFSTLSHELRTPLNPILGWTRMLQGQKLPPEQVTQALEAIERNVKHQTRLVDDLLDVSRVIQGKLRLSSHPVDLALILADAIQTVHFAAQAKSITVRFEPSVSVYTIGDRDRLEQIFWNLLSNAVKFTPEGGQVAIELSVSHDGCGQSCQIRITDTGIGIASDFLPHVFESFRQAESGSTRRYGGLGLGLAIVRHLVELHGGIVTVESPGLGQGAMFTVNLPLVDDDNRLNRMASSSQTMGVVNASRVETAASSNLQSSKVKNLSRSLANVQILLIDDEPDNLELMRFLLHEEGAIIRTFTSPSAAFHALSQSPPDLLISDIGMPEMDGHELIGRVRSLSPHQGGQVPAIALTAFAQRADQQRAIDAGYQAYIAKPVDPAQVITTIAQILS